MTTTPPAKKQPAKKKPARQPASATGPKRRYKRKPLIFEPSEAVLMTEEQEREAVDLMVTLVDSYVVRHRNDPPRAPADLDEHPDDPYAATTRLPLAERQDLLGRAVARWLARPNPADRYREEGKSIDRLIRERTRAIERYERAFEEGTMPEELLSDRVAELKEIREQLRRRKKEITAHLRDGAGQRDAACLEGVSLGEFVGEVLQAHPDLPVIKAFYRLLIERIWVGPGRHIFPIFRIPLPPGFVWPEPESPPKPSPRPGGDVVGEAMLQRLGDDTWGRFNWVMHEQPSERRMIARSSERATPIHFRHAFDFARLQGWSVLTTMRRDGRPQLSNVAHVLGPDGRLRVSVTADRAKVHNLTRDPWAALHITSVDFCQYVVIEGDVELSAVAAAPDDATVDELVTFAVARSGGPLHELVNEPAYRAACVAEHRVVIRLLPLHTYGLLRPLPIEEWW